MLPPHIRDAYPVYPRYALNQQFHFTRQKTDELDEILITYGNGEFFSQSQYQKLNLE
jgi:hypothetical protein